MAAIAFVAVCFVALLPPGMLLGSSDSTTVQQFVAWRAFATESVLQGHLPLWNPYTYAGEPFAGGFQSALFYPPNLIFLILPIERAINLSFVLHMLWLAVGMDRWARRRGLHPVASMLSSLTLALGGAAYMNVPAANLSNVCSMAWAPWIFLALDRWFESGAWPMLLGAAASVALQILAGHVQYVFFTGVAVGLYALLRVVFQPTLWRRALSMLGAAYGGAAILAAIQLFPAWAAAREGLHHGRLDFEYVRIFSFPFENLITLVAPGFFGGSAFGSEYWGRCNVGAMLVFVGASGLVLLGTALRDRASWRVVRIDVLMVICLFLLAFGAHTPLLRALYDWVPGFGSFRGLSKFTFPAALFLTLAIGAGADAIARGRLPGRRLASGIAIAGIGLAAAGTWLWANPQHIAGMLLMVRDSRESALSPDVFADAGFVGTAGTEAGLALLVAGLTVAVAAFSLRLASRVRPLRWTPLMLLSIEMVAFASSHTTTSSLADTMPEDRQAFLSKHPGDYRVLDLQAPDNGFLFGKSDIWGDDPAVLKRYAEFMAASIGGNPDYATQGLPFRALMPVHGLVRLKYAFGPANADTSVIESPYPALPHVLLIPDYRVMGSRDDQLQELNREGFDPQKIVLLESEPDPRPSAAPVPGAGAARVITETANTLEIEADTASPAILLVTDSYSHDWHARALGASAQSAYSVMPADYALRAVPLAAGHHHLVLEYAPPFFALGAMISLAGWCTVLWLVLFKRT